MKLFGHRGAAGLIEENTLESIAKALSYNVHGIEIDVHCCKSGELVVIHDETLDRTTTAQGNVSDYTLKALKKIKTKAGYTIPSLEEVLELIDGKCELNVELKGKKTSLPVLNLLEEYIKNTSWTHDHFVISSFDHSQLFDLKKNSSKFKIGVLTEENITEVLPVSKELAAYSIHPPIKSLTGKEVLQAQKLGYKVYVWTVNTEKLIATSKEWGVDTVITDFPNFV